jgi:hypothetical protein
MPTKATLRCGAENGFLLNLEIVMTKIATNKIERSDQAK